MTPNQLDKIIVFIATRNKMPDLGIAIFVAWAVSLT
jgi:hypothetical protein